MAAAAPGSRWQLERVGYFVVDTVDSRPGAPVLNRIVGLRDATAEAAVQAAPAARSAAPAPASSEPAKGKVRPPKRSQAEYRAEARARDPELAAEHVRFQSELGLSVEAADLLAGDRDTAKLFASAAAASGLPAAAARLLINDLPRALGDRQIASLSVGGAELGELVRLVADGAVSGPAAKEVLAALVTEGGKPAEIVARLGLDRKTDAGALEALVDAALAENPDKVAAFRAGKTGLLGFFVGAVVKAAGGRANPAQVKALVAARLG